MYVGGKLLAAEEDIRLKKGWRVDQGVICMRRGCESQHIATHVRLPGISLKLERGVRFGVMGMDGLGCGS